MADFMIEGFLTPDGLPNARIKKNGKTITLHSVAPLKEAEKTASGLNPGMEWTVIAGFGMGYMTEYLLKNTAFRIVVYEHSPEILDYASGKRDIAGMLSNPRVKLIRGEVSELTDFLDQNGIRELNFTIHRPYYQMFPEVYSRLEGILIAYLSKKEINRATLRRFQKVWLKNIIRDSEYYFTRPGISALGDKFSGRPAVIAGAGPSLGKSLPVLKKIQDRTLVIATDTALSMLYANGVRADIVVSVDPQEKNAYYLLYSKYKDAVLVADSAASYLSFMKYNPARTVLFDTMFPAYETLIPFWGEKGKLLSGGSVSTTAFDLARVLKCDPIVFIGQDLSFSRKHTHFRGNILEEQFYHRTDRMKTFEDYNSRSLVLADRIEMKGLDGKKALTDRKFLTFLDWFKREIARTGAKVINSTAEGLLLEGAEHMPLERTAEIYMKNAFDKDIRLQELSLDSRSYLQFLDGVLNEFRKLKPLSLKAYASSRSIGKMKSGTREYSSTLNTMNEFDRVLVDSVREKSAVGRFIEFTMQESIEAVMEQDETDREALTRTWENFYRDAYYGILQIERLVSKRLANR